MLCETAHQVNEARPTDRDARVVRPWTEHCQPAKVVLQC
jgi:hypothetical protein